MVATLYVIDSCAAVVVIVIVPVVNLFPLLLYFIL